MRRAAHAAARKGAERAAVQAPRGSDTPVHGAKQSTAEQVLTFLRDGFETSADIARIGGLCALTSALEVSALSDMHTCGAVVNHHTAASRA